MKYSKEVIDFLAISKTKKKLNYSKTPIGQLIKKETNFLEKYHPNAGLRERLYYVENGLFEIISCKKCSKITNWNNGPTFLCGSCVKKTESYKNACKKTKLEKYGNETYNNSKLAKKTKLEKYGNETYNNSDKIKNTYTKNHGSIGFANKNINKLAIKNYQFKNVIIGKYKTFSQIDNIKQKMSITIKNNHANRYNNWLTLYKNSNNLDSKNLKILYNNINNYTWLSNQLKIYSPSQLASKLGYDRQSFFKKLYNFGLYKYEGRSYFENEVLDFCKSLTSNVISNSRSIIKPLEIDVYLPDYNLAIELDGLFWHSSYSMDSENKERHLHKTQECEKQGIQLFHIFENEWLDPVKQNIWKSIIKNRLGKSERIYARKTEIRSVISKDKTEFLDSNHLQGDCNSSVNLGLYLDDELVSLMTFGKSRYNKNIDWELLRFCNKIGTSVVGGAGKLLHIFKRGHFGSIISYADRRRSNGNLYKQLGFELTHDSGPNYFYWKPGDSILQSRVKYQKHKLKDKLDNFDPELTESENMYNNGYRKIYDCGNYVYSLYKYK